MTQKTGLMLLAAGASAMLLAGKENRGHLPSFRGVCEVRASLPGRMRLYVPMISEDVQQAAQAREKLLSTGVVREVTFNPRIGTALIVYDEKQAEGAVIEGAFIRLMGLDAAISAHPMSRAEAAMRTLLDGIDHALMEKTNGLVDGRILLSGGLAAAGLWKLRTLGANVPGATTLLWWASSLFRSGCNV